MAINSKLSRMRNIFLFLRHYRIFFTFLFLQVLALWFLFSFNRFHRTKGMGIANEVTGWVNSKYDKVGHFIHQGEENARLNKFNDSLLNLLPGNFTKHDTGTFQKQDSIPYDTAGQYRRYFYRPAKVVYNTVNSAKNYLQLNRGSAQGIKDNMAVISSYGSVVGIVVNTSPNFCQVMSLLHVKNAVSISLKKSGDLGTAEWDGKDPRFLTIKKIAKTTELKIGDSVLTSPVSFNFPPGLMVGTISAIKIDNASGMYQLKIKTTTNFSTIQQVHIIEQVDYSEQSALFKETLKKEEGQPQKTK